MGQWKRKRVTVDFRLQGKFCLRVAAYWAFCAATVAFLMVGRNSIAGQDVGASFATRAAFVSLLVLPLVLLDCLIFTSRYAGPIRRIQVGLKKLADGGTLQGFSLREADEYQAIAADLNRVALELQMLRSSAIKQQATVSADACAEDSQ